MTIFGIVARSIYVGLMLMFAHCAALAQVSYEHWHSQVLPQFENIENDATPSIAVDQYGRPHILYLDESSGSPIVYYATIRDGVWEIEPLPEEYNADPGQIIVAPNGDLYSAIVADRYSDDPRITLVMRDHQTGDWTVWDYPERYYRKLSPQRLTVQLAVQDGIPHMVYTTQFQDYDIYGPIELIHLTLQNGQWSREIISIPDGYINAPPIIDFKSNGQAVIYVGFSPGYDHLALVMQESSGWKETIIPLSVDANHFQPVTNMLVDQRDQVHFVFEDSPKIFHGVIQDGAIETEVVYDDNNWNPNGVDFAIDSSYNPVLTFYGVGRGGFSSRYVTYKDDGNWSTSRMNIISHQRQSGLVIALNRFDTPFITFTTKDRINLIYSGNPWRRTLIADDIDNAGYAAMDISPLDRKGFVCYDENSQAVLFFDEISGEWVQETVTNMPVDVTDIAFDFKYQSDNTPVITINTLGGSYIAVRNDGEWTLEPIGDGLKLPHIERDQSGQLWVAYNNEAGIKLMQEDGDSWLTSSIPSENFIVCDLALHDGHAYLLAASEAGYHLYLPNGEWELIDEINENNEGALAITSSGIIHATLDAQDYAMRHNGEWQIDRETHYTFLYRPPMKSHGEQVYSLSGYQINHINGQTLTRNIDAKGTAHDLAIDSHGEVFLLDFQYSDIFLAFQDTNASNWNSSNFTAELLTDEEIVGPTANPDHDAFPNIFERLLWLDPNTHDRNRTVFRDPLDNRLCIQVMLRAKASGASLKFQFSGDLVHWDTLATYSSESGVSNEGSGGIIEVLLTDKLMVTVRDKDGSTTNRYARIIAELSE